MKKMLGFLSAIGLIATTSIATISCNPTNRIIISKYNGLSSIKNERIWRSSEAFVSLDELKALIKSDQDNSDKKYASSRLKALATNNFIEGKFKCWSDLKDAKLVFYKQVPVSIVNPLGYSIITESDFDEKSNVDLRFIKFEFIKNDKETKQTSEKLSLRTLPKLDQIDNFKEGSNLKLKNAEPSLLDQGLLDRSIVNIFDRYTPSITSFLSSKGIKKSDDITKELKSEIKESSRFNELLKSIASYLSEVVKLVNSESGIIKFDDEKKEFSYTPRKTHILEFLQKDNSKNKVFEVLKQILFKEKDQIDYIDILDGFVFDEKSGEYVNNEKEILTTIKTKAQNNNG
ncbi:lipoprotein [Mycoplasma sp. HU2014]|uniref:lipoprotein n=1 Tax=Mycoplasma sp. HU2014 TaxID=1664275 RepID=UPI00067D1A54|nr:lipoprotein [Mycoplasma sp. HU2014]KNG79313.1 lipoprotein [Mycoplasma sp. HU2014]